MFQFQGPPTYENITLQCYICYGTEVHRINVFLKKNSNKFCICQDILFCEIIINLFVQPTTLIVFIVVNYHSVNQA